MSAFTSYVLQGKFNLPLKMSYFKRVNIKFGVMEIRWMIVLSDDAQDLQAEFFIVSDWKSDPVGREGQALRWVPRERLDAEELLPDDIPVIEALQQNH